MLYSFFLTVKHLLYTPIMDTTPRRGPAPTKHLDILEAATRLFARQGVAQTSTRDIAAEAGTTERTLFKHFGSKDGLVQAVMAEAVLPHLVPASLQGLQKALAAHAGQMADWHAALLHERQQNWARSPDLARLLLTELLRDDMLRAQFADQWQAAVWRPLARLFERLQANGTLRADLPAAALARQFLTLNLGYLIARTVLAPDLPWDDAAEQAGIASLFELGAGRRR